MPASRVFRGGAAVALLVLGLAASARPAASQSLGSALLIGRGTHLIDVNLGYGRWLEPGAPDGSFGFGVGFLHFPSDNTALGVDVTADGLGSRTLANGREANLELISVVAQGLIHPAMHAATPYLGVGAGPYVFRASTDESGETETNWGIMGRAGVRMVGWRPILGLDFRHHWIMLDPESKTSPAPGQRVTRAFSAKLTVSFLF